jgi:hypothetical protein
MHAQQGGEDPGKANSFEKHWVKIWHYENEPKF